MAEDKQSQHKRNLRLMIIGLDGADWAILQPYIDAGELPTLAGLCAEGCHGTMRSTVPPVTPCAWTTLFTGVNPGKHGVFDFVRSRCGGEVELTSGASRKAPTIWQLANAAGLTWGMLNAPWTYPPDDLDGYMISGMGTPRFGPEMASPRSLFPHLQGLVGEYALEPSKELWLRQNPRAENIDDEIRKLTTVAKWLLRERPTDVFMMVFLITDLVQHGFLGNRSLTSVSGKVITDTVLYMYKLVDAAVGELIAAAGNNVPVMVISDHGGAPFQRFVNMDAVFRELGLLRLRSGGGLGGRLRQWLWGLGYRLKDALPEGALNRLRGAGQRARKAVAAEKQHVEGLELDWARTIAVPMPSFGMIRMNVKGRDEAGVIAPGAEYEASCEKVTEGLLGYRDPLDGQAVFAEVLRGRDIYTGPYVEAGPDLIAIPAGTRFHFYSPQVFADKALNARRPAVMNADPTYTGTHSPEGIIVATGGIFGRGELEECHLQDVAPSLLAALGVAIPTSMDGHIVEGLLDREFAAANPPVYDEAPDGGLCSDEGRKSDEQVAVGEAEEEVDFAGYSEDEAAVVEQRLKDLGYL